MRRTLGVRGMLLAAALSATLPTIRWCPLRWEQIDAARFLRCTTMVAAGLPSCGTPTRAPAAASEGDDCRNSCASRLGVAPCPLADATARRTAGGEPSPRRHGHVYFLGDAAYARALRGSARFSAPALRAMALPVAAASIPPPSRAHESPRLAEPRPPRRAATAPPPARAPPLEA